MKERTGGTKSQGSTKVQNMVNPHTGKRDAEYTKKILAKQAAEGGGVLGAAASGGGGGRIVAEAVDDEGPIDLEAEAAKAAAKAKKKKKKKKVAEFTAF